MVESFLPSTLTEALAIRASGMAVPYAGGTDLMVRPPDEIGYLFIGKIPDLRRIIQDDRHIRVGAACTFTEILENDRAPALLKEACSRIGGPAIRNLGTIGGNIGSGSPKADSALVLFAADAELRLLSSRGERIIPMKEFYLGRNRTALQSDELIAEILMPASGIDNYYYKKIGARRAQAISRVSFAGILNITHDRITGCRTAFGAVSDVVIRRDDIDSMLAGKTVAEARALRPAYLAAYNEAIVPIRGRVSAEYRKAVCMNLLEDFLEQNGI